MRTIANVVRRLVAAPGVSPDEENYPSGLSAAREELVHALEAIASLSPTFGDTVRRLDRELFVGRVEEIGIFRQWLETDTRLPLLLNVTGPTGIGKSSLLRTYRRFAGGLGRAVRLVDVRTFPPNPTGFLRAMGGSNPADLQRHLNQANSILLLDSFDTPSDMWDYLRDEFLPGLEVGVKVVVAGRQPVGSSWVANSQWQRVIRPLPLNGLSAAESRVYLRRCGLEDRRLVQEILTATTGYPLLLSLAASLLQVKDARPFSATPQWQLIVHSVAEHLLIEIEDPRLRSLLEACAVIGAFDEVSLMALAGADDGPAAFARLCGASLVEPTKNGLMLHHNLRRVLMTDLKWRRPAAYRTLRNWARARAALPLDQEPLDGLLVPPTEALPASQTERQPKRAPMNEGLSTLTLREREVLGVLGRGRTTSREIAAELVISQGTANLHVKRVLRKLGFMSRAELAKWWATQTSIAT